MGSEGVTAYALFSQEHDACAEAEENLQRLLVKKTDLETHLQVREGVAWVACSLELEE